MNQNFFSKINYSASNEDSESERRALKINDKDIVLCITGSGARTLDLLIDSPQKIISIDMNASQNHLLALKMAAYRSFDYADFCRFIGLTASSKRLDLYQKLSPFLDENTQKYWNNQLDLIEKGVLYCGTWERFLNVMRKLSFTRKRLIERLMNAENLAQQQAIWQNDWDNVVWRGYLKLLSNRFFWVNIIREPGAKIIDKNFDVYQYMKTRMDFMASHLLLRKAHYANLLFNGSYTKDCVLPHHLRPENFDIIKQNLAKVEIVTDSLSDYLQKQKNTISAFSLSDFSSYAPLPIYQEIWKNVIQAATENAKFCERQFLVKRNPEDFFSEINRNTALEKELFISDETAIYSFCVGEISNHQTLTKF